MTREELDYHQRIRLSLSDLNPSTKHHNPPFPYYYKFPTIIPPLPLFPHYPISLNSLIPDLISLRTKGGRIYSILCSSVIAHLTKWVFGVCLSGPAKRAGHRRENGSFFGLEDKSPMEGGTSDRGRLVFRQKAAAVFLPRKPGEAID